MQSVTESSRLSSPTSAPLPRSPHPCPRCLVDRVNGSQECRDTAAVFRERLTEADRASPCGLPGIGVTAAPQSDAPEMCSNSTAYGSLLPRSGFVCFLHDGRALCQDSAARTRCGGGLCVDLVSRAGRRVRVAP